MGRCIVKLAPNEYVEWSTVVDAPISWVMSYGRMLARMTAESDTDQDFNQRFERLNQYGTTMFNDRSPNDTIYFNRSGPNGECLTLGAIRRYYQSPEAQDEFTLQPDDVV